MKHSRWLAALLTLALLAVPSGASAQSDAKVTGEVLYRERIALPPSAVLKVQLQDVSFADAPATVLAEQVIQPMGKAPPYAFELAYDSAKIDERNSYAVRAEIRDGDRLLFVTTERYAVITQGNPSSGLTLVLQMINAPTPPATLPVEVLDRDWDLTSLQRAPGDSIDAVGKGITIRFGTDGRATGSGGCNRYSGSYAVAANGGLTFGPVAATRRACAPDVSNLENAYFNALGSVASYKLDGATLQLGFNNGQGLLTYSAPAAKETCFEQTGHCVSGRFLEFWQSNGGLPVFGLPLSDQLTENGSTVQYFERQRFELHADNPAPYDVLLGRLGDELLKRQGIDWFTLDKADAAKEGCQLFGETQHNVCDVQDGASFLTYWRTHGLEFDGRPGKTYAESLALFGLPLSEPRMETNADGSQVLTQWFERARFEYHPGNPLASRVLLGRLGAEIQPNP
ncbi:MAG TPA: YbaY family lipoprotein [Roseiflexaceae bacterium]|nr:YbaY family lipoprotein [Roseiflexaceae bacterium]